MQPDYVIVLEAPGAEATSGQTNADTDRRQHGGKAWGKPAIIGETPSTERTEYRVRLSRLLTGGSAGYI